MQHHKPSSSHLLATARGHGHSPPSIQFIHLAHELLSSSASNQPSTSCSSSPHGLLFLRSATLTTARVLQDLSTGYNRLQAASPDLGDTQEQEETEEVEIIDQPEASPLPATPTACPSDTTERCAREASVVSGGVSGSAIWPVGCTRVGEVLAQCIHCLCGLKPGGGGSSDSSGSTIGTSSSGSSAASNSSRFKVSV